MKPQRGSGWNLKSGAAASKSKEANSPKGSDPK